MKVYVISCVNFGLMEKPIVFTDAEKADKLYIKILEDYYKGSYSSLVDARQAADENSDDFFDVYYWEVNVER